MQVIWKSFKSCLEGKIQNLSRSQYSKVILKSSQIHKSYCFMQVWKNSSFEVRKILRALLAPQLKVRQIRNDFFNPTFLPKNEWTKSTLLLVNLFSFVFWKKVKTSKRHFEIIWPLATPKLEHFLKHLIWNHKLYFIIKCLAPLWRPKAQHCRSSRGVTGCSLTENWYAHYPKQP